MGTFLLIIQIISAIPTIIKIVKQIIEMIRKLPKNQQTEFKEKLKLAIERSRLAKKVSAEPTLARDLESILGELKEKVGSKNP